MGYSLALELLPGTAVQFATMYTKFASHKLPSYSKMDSNLDETFISVPPTPTSPKAPLSPVVLPTVTGRDQADLLEMGLYVPIRIELGKPEPAGLSTPRKDYAFWIFLCAILCIFAVACATVLHITASQLNQFQQLRTMELYRNIS